MVSNFLTCQDCGNTLEETINILMEKLLSGETLDTSQLELLQEDVKKWKPDEMFRCPDCRLKLQADKEKLFALLDYGTSFGTALNWRYFPEIVLYGEDDYV
tara:strand:- start:2237 stop:2539 length:303 start_codon:yes stop_codon:yes gene_type:complete